MPHYVGLQLCLGRNKLFHLSKLIVKVEALRVQKCTGRFDLLARHYLLHWQLNLFQINRYLKGILLAHLKNCLFSLNNADSTYWNCGCLKDVLGDMPSAKRFSNRIFDAGHQLLIKLEAWSHQEEQNDRFVCIFGSTLSNTNRIDNLFSELSVDNVVYLCRSEPYTGGIQNTVRSPEEENLA